MNKKTLLILVVSPVEAVAISCHMTNHDRRSRFGKDHEKAFKATPYPMLFALW